MHTHTCTHTHTRVHTHTEEMQQPRRSCLRHLLSPHIAGEAEPKGTAVPARPAHSQTPSRFPPRTGNHSFCFGGRGEPRPVAHMSPTPRAGGDGSPEPGTGLLKGRSR